MTRSMGTTLLILASTLAGLTGCKHAPQAYSNPSNPGIESCPSRQFPSDYHPPAPPNGYFPGPLNSKTQVPNGTDPHQTAPNGTDQIPSIEEAPLPKPLPQAPKLQAPPKEEGPTLEDDSTASLRTEREQFFSQRSTDPWFRAERSVQPVRLLRVVEVSAAEDELLELQAQPLQGNPSLQSPPTLQSPNSVQPPASRPLPPAMYAPGQSGQSPVCGVARPQIEELPPSYIDAPSLPDDRPNLFQKLMQPRSKGTTQSAAAYPPAYR